MANSKDFSGKIALVTGSSSGIGEELVIQFAKYGAQVIVTGRSQDRIDAVVEKSNKVSPNNLKALGIKCDLMKDIEMERLVKRVVDTYGGLDILVNNAGIFTLGASHDADIMEKFDMSLRTNLRAPFKLTHLLTPHLIKTKGNIINISSVGSLHPIENGCASCSVKAGLDMFTKCLSIDLGPKGVRVNSVCPAAVRTPIFDNIGEDNFNALAKHCAEKYPMGRMGEVDDVARMVLFLASNDASFITGLVAQVDGGSLHTTICGKQ